MVLVLQNLFFLVSGFVLLILSGDKLVETSIQIARRWRIPTSVIAVTIIAAGTSAPELVTSFLAGFKGQGDIAVGNVIGSNIFNILAVGGLSLALHPVGSIRGTFVSWVVLSLSSLLFFFFMQDLRLVPQEAALLLAALGAFLILSFFQRAQSENDIETAEVTSLTRTFVFFLISLLGLVLGAELALDSGVALGRIAGLSERVIAITIISVGTGLPELATSMAAAFRGHSEMAIANIIGSNIFNTLAIPGATASFFALQVAPQFINFDFYIMVAATASIAVMYGITSKKGRQRTGWLFFLGYAFYATYLLYSSL